MNEYAVSAVKPVTRKLQEMSARDVLAAVDLHMGAAELAQRMIERSSLEYNATRAGQHTPDQVLRNLRDLKEAQETQAQAKRLWAAIHALWPSKYHRFVLSSTIHRWWPHGK